MISGGIEADLTVTRTRRSTKFLGGQPSAAGPDPGLGIGCAEEPANGSVTSEIADIT